MSQTPSDPPPPTLRLCEACGKNGDVCIWCTNGYQNLAQRQAWHEFRSQVKSQSSIHSLLRELVEEVIDKLEATENNNKYVNVIDEGKKIMYEWIYANPDDTGYAALTRQLSEFTKNALEIISNVYL